MMQKSSHPSLIIRLPNWVGDVIMALPALQSLQQADIELLLFGKHWANDLLAATGMKVTSIDKSFWKTTHIMSKVTDCNKALLLTNHISSALMAYFAGKAAIGYKTYGRYPFLEICISKKSSLHEVQYFWNIAHTAGQYWFPELLSAYSVLPPKINLPCSSSAIATAQHVLNIHQIKQPFWIVCPFAHGTGKDGASKIWPHWRELSVHLNHRQLVVCPAKNEEALCAELAPGATVLSGLNLGEYAAVLAEAEFVVANDSGPMHIAAAVGTRTLGIFGVTDPKRTGPWGGESIGEKDMWPTLSEVLEKLADLH